MTGYKCMDLRKNNEVMNNNQATIG